ncbi:MAG: hypothetical protein K1060chlam5_00662 [Candidatus Anoxychlamydiales bacterium]|nr:hypothetical protein [Candidatus Anoxychlamydiales bacterium]
MSFIWTAVKSLAVSAVGVSPTELLHTPAETQTVEKLNDIYNQGTDKERIERIKATAVRILAVDEKSVPKADRAKLKAVKMLFQKAQTTPSDDKTNPSHNIDNLAQRILSFSSDHPQTGLDDDSLVIELLNIYKPTGQTSFIPQSTPAAAAAPSISPAGATTPKENEVKIFGKTFYLKKFITVKGKKKYITMSDKEKESWKKQIEALLKAKGIKETNDISVVTLTFKLNDQQEFDLSKEAQIKYTDKSGEQIIHTGKIDSALEKSDANLFQALLPLYNLSKNHPFKTPVLCKVKGSQNIKNNCFIISSMQALIADPKLKAFYSNPENKDKLDSSSDKQEANKKLFDAIHAFIKAYDECKKDAIDAKYAQDIRIALKTAMTNGIITDENQADATQVISYLRQLKENETKITTVTKWESITPEEGKQSQTEISAGNPSYLSLKPSITKKLDKEEIQKIYDGTPPESDTENIEGIGEATISSQKYFFSQSPDNLDFEIHRFTHDAKSKTTRDDSEMTIAPKLEDMELSKDKESTSKYPTASYELTSIISHTGSAPNSGHYYTYAKRDGTWYELSDDRVTEISQDEVLKRAAKTAVYVSYSKIETAATPAPTPTPTA